MKNILWFNISRKDNIWILTGQVGEEKISETHETQQECTQRATEIIKASNYLKGEK